MNRVYVWLNGQKFFMRKRKGEDAYDIGLAGRESFIGMAGSIYRQTYSMEETVQTAINIAFAEGLVVAEAA